MFIDSHVPLDSSHNAEIGEILERGRAVGVQAVISAGTTLESTKRAVELTDVFPDFFAGVGIHPMDISEPFTDDTYAQLRDMALSTEKVLVISEVGLDFMEGTPDRADQYHAFREQIRLARELKLPIVFHSRDAHEESFRVLKEERAYEIGGIMHYFQGDAETARKVIDLGFYISLARPLLRFSYLQDAAVEIPLANIVLETDAAPQPFKSKRENWTEPRHVAIVAQKLAELKDLPVSEIEEATTRNMRDVLGDKWDVLAAHVNVASIL